MLMHMRASEVSASLSPHTDLEGIEYYYSACIEYYYSFVLHYSWLQLRSDMHVAAGQICGYPSSCFN